jgi:hypothetical protein
VRSEQLVETVEAAVQAHYDFLGVMVILEFGDDGRRQGND